MTSHPTDAEHELEYQEQGLDLLEPGSAVRQMFGVVLLPPYPPVGVGRGRVKQTRF